MSESKTAEADTSAADDTSEVEDTAAEERRPVVEDTSAVVAVTIIAAVNLSLKDTTVAEKPKSSPDSLEAGNKSKAGEDCEYVADCCSAAAVCVVLKTAVTWVGGDKDANAEDAKLPSEDRSELPTTEGAPSPTVVKVDERIVELEVRFPLVVGVNELYKTTGLCSVETAPSDDEGGGASVGAADGKDCALAP